MSDELFNVVNLQDSMNPRPEETTSRTIFQDDRIKVVLFGFGAGQELSEHTSSKPAVMHFLSGEATVGLGGKPIDATAGTWIHMTAGQPHSIVARTPAVMLLTLLK